MSASNTATPTESASNPKWDHERKTFGPISGCSLIGHLGADAVFHPAEQRPDGSMTKPRVSGRVAVSRGENYDSSWFSFNVYGGTNANGDDSSRPTDDQLQELASSLSKSQRVRIQGVMEFLKTSEDNYTAACEAINVAPNSDEARKIPWLRSLFFGGTARVTMFVTSDQIASISNKDGKRQPITLLDPIGDSNQSDDRLPY